MRRSTTVGAVGSGYACARSYLVVWSLRCVCVCMQRRICCRELKACRLCKEAPVGVSLLGRVGALAFFRQGPDILALFSLAHSLFVCAWACLPFAFFFMIFVAWICSFVCCWLAAKPLHDSADIYACVPPPPPPLHVP